MSLINTMMQNLRVASNVDKYEFRASNYGAWDLFLRQTDAPNSIITEEMKSKFLSSVGRTFQTWVFNYEGVSINVGVARSVTLTRSENTTALVTYTPTTISFSFSQVPEMFMNNEVDRERDFQVKMRKYILATLAYLDSLCVTNLSTNKTSVFTDTLELTTSSNVLTATYAQKDMLLSSVQSAMAANDYFDQLYLVGDFGLMQHIKQLEQHGLYNDQHKALEYNGLNLGFTNRCVRDAGILRGFAVQSGSVGVMTRLDREALVRRKSGTSHEWGSVYIPEIGLTFGTLEYDSVGDKSDIAGDATVDMTAAYEHFYGFSLDIVLVNSYCSAPTTIARPIMEFTAAASN